MFDYKKLLQNLTCETSNWSSYTNFVGSQEIAFRNNDHDLQVVHVGTKITSRYKKIFVMFKFITISHPHPDFPTLILFIYSVHRCFCCSSLRNFYIKFEHFSSEIMHASMTSLSISLKKFSLCLPSCLKQRSVRKSSCKFCIVIPYAKFFGNVLVLRTSKRQTANNGERLICLTDLRACFNSFVLYECIYVLLMHFAAKLFIFPYKARK